MRPLVVRGVPTAGSRREARGLPQSRRRSTTAGPKRSSASGSGPRRLLPGSLASILPAGPRLPARPPLTHRPGPCPSAGRAAPASGPGLTWRRRRQRWRRRRRSRDGERRRLWANWRRLRRPRSCASQPLQGTMGKEGAATATTLIDAIRAARSGLWEL